MLRVCNLGIILTEKDGSFPYYFAAVKETANNKGRRSLTGLRRPENKGVKLSAAASMPHIIKG
jgi:hypothetical protein